MTRPLSLIPVALAPLACLVLLFGSHDVEARGCIKGAAVGAVAGHLAGHHGVLGAVAGCAVGHHLAKKQQRALREQQLHPQQAPKPVPQPPQPASEAVAIT